ncbi:MAG TPA: hypothetical protein ENN60_01405 [archaeon]|nr:hypothetical protein [archaeon]
MSNDSRAVCTRCGKTMPRTKLVPSYRRIFGEERKQYLCIVCAKRAGIPVKQTRQRVIHGVGRARRSQGRARQERRQRY